LTNLDVTLSLPITGTVTNVAPVSVLEGPGSLPGPIAAQIQPTRPNLVRFLVLTCFDGSHPRSGEPINNFDIEVSLGSSWWNRDIRDNQLRVISQLDQKAQVSLLCPETLRQADIVAHSF
jgi:hypothetical protein